MKRILFSLSLFGSFLASANAQEQTISFEEVEGYAEGNLIGQNTWVSYGFLTEGHGIVSSNKASTGNLSAQIIPDPENEGNWGGIVYHLPEAQKFIISADVNLDELYGSDYDLLSIYDNASGEFEYISGFYFDFMGDLIIGDANTTQASENWQPNTWYNLKADYDFTDRTVDLFLNNNFIRTVSIPRNITNATEVDFEFDNYSGLNVDNVKIINLDNLSNYDLAFKNLTIFPNPTTDYINVKYPKKIKALEILDFDGKIVANNRNSAQINVEHLPNGIYFIKIYQTEGVTVRIFVKK